jgi:nucleolar complex protein 3
LSSLSPLQQADNEHISHLAILSLLLIFKDILPAYRIRLPTQQEMAIKVSKDTKQMWDYERALLQHYQQYLQLLEATWKQKTSNSNKAEKKKHGHAEQQQQQESAAAAPSKCAVTSILSLADLLKSAFHFNFRSNLLTAVVQSMNHANETVRIACCGAISHVFVHDAQGEVALEATRRVTKMIQKRNYKVRPVVLQTLAKLPLRVHVDEAQAAKLTAKANAKKRKKNKELAAIESESIAS